MSDDAPDLSYLRKLLQYHGICIRCGELLHHELNAPFASCSCGTQEFYRKTPHMLLQERHSRLRRRLQEVTEQIEMDDH